MIIAIIEHNRGTLNQQSLEVLSLARELDEVQAVVVGENGRIVAEELKNSGIKKVHLLLHPELDEYAPVAWAKSIVQLAGLLNPKAIMVTATERGNEIIAHIASQLNLPLAANCTEVEFQDQSCYLTRIRWGGSLLERAKFHSRLFLLSLAPFTRNVEAFAKVEIDIVETNVELDAMDLEVKVVSESAPESEKILLTDAKVVVSGGRGVGSKEGFEILEELAESLGGAVGCSRVVTNNGWRPHSDQVGQTGARVAPDLYIACGISGAIQHYVGCKSSKKILVINTDPEAPIVPKSDYAIIGDLHQVVPEINRLLKERLSSLK